MATPLRYILRHYWPRRCRFSRYIRHSHASLMIEMLMLQRHMPLRHYDAASYAMLITTLLPMLR